MRIREHKSQKVSCSLDTVLPPPLPSARALDATSDAAAALLKSPPKHVQAAAKIEESLKEWDPAKDSTIEVHANTALNFLFRCRPCW